MWIYPEAVSSLVSSKLFILADFFHNRKLTKSSQSNYDYLPYEYISTMEER